MKELNFNFALKDLSGTEVPEANAGKILANVLGSDNGKNPVKFSGWALLLFAKKPICIDAQDIDLLKTFILDSINLNALQKAQLLEVINKPE